MAEIQSYQNEVELNALYARAMDLSHESVTEALDLLNEAQQKSDEQTRDNFFTLTGQAQTYKNRGMSIPQSVLDAYGIEQGDYTGWLEGIERDMREQMLDNRLWRSIGSARVGDYAFDTYLKNDGKTDLAGIDAIAQGIINGTLTLEEAFEQADSIIGEMNQKDAEATAKGIDTLMKEISASIPFEELLAQIQWQKEKTGTVSEELMELYKDYLITGLFDGTVMDSFIGGLMGKNPSTCMPTLPEASEEAPQTDARPHALTPTADTRTRHPYSEKRAENGRYRRKRRKTRADCCGGRRRGADFLRKKSIRRKTGRKRPP